MYDEGKENWTAWAEYVGMPLGSSKQGGDHGIWWPPVPGQLVLLGFEGGNPEKPYFIPAGPWKDQETLLPKEIISRIQQASDGAINQIRVIKSPSGHTICMDDNPNEEFMYICDWTGAMQYWASPSKNGKVEQAQQCSESNMKEGANRGDKLALSGNAVSPGETKDQEFTNGFCDPSGQGWMCRSKSDGGMMAFWCGEGVGDLACSIVMDTFTKSITMTAGETQFVLDGEKGAIFVTRQMIVERPYDDSLIESIKNRLTQLKNVFKNLYSSSSSASSSSGDSGGGTVA